MKSARLRYSYRKSASSLHRTIGNILRTHELFKNLQCFQEYPVKRINPKYKSSREKFDWIILDWSVIIECHGAWHYEKIPWGNQTEATVKLQKQQQSDEAKKQAALNANWTYIALTYQEIESGITGEQLLERIQDHRRLVFKLPRENSGKKSIPEPPGSPRSLEALQGLAQNRKRTAREYKKLQYRKLKELKKQWKLKKQELDS